MHRWSFWQAGFMICSVWGDLFLGHLRFFLLLGWVGCSVLGVELFESFGGYFEVVCCVFCGYVVLFVLL
jgi:hypothetical protein